MSLDRYDKKFQKYLLGEALKGNNAFMDNLDPKADNTVWMTDGKVIKGIHKDENFLRLKKYNLCPLIYETYTLNLKYGTYTLEEIPEPYHYCKVKGIKNLCLKVNDSTFIDTKYLGFFDMEKSTLYNTQKGLILVCEDDRVSGAILGIKGKEME